MIYSKAPDGVGRAAMALPGENLQIVGTRNPDRGPGGRFACEIVLISGIPYTQGGPVPHCRADRCVRLCKFRKAGGLPLQSGGRSMRTEACLYLNNSREIFRSFKRQGTPRRDHNILKNNKMSIFTPRSQEGVKTMISL